MLVFVCNGREDCTLGLLDTLHLPPVQSPRPPHHFPQLEHKWKETTKFCDQLECYIMGCRAKLCLSFPSSVMKVQFNPRDKGAFLVCLLKQTPALVTLKGEGLVRTPLLTDGEPEISMTRDFNDWIL